MLKHVWGMFSRFVLGLGVSKDKIVSFGVWWRFKKPEIIEMRSSGLSYEQIEILLYQIEAE